MPEIRGDLIRLALRDVALFSELPESLLDAVAADTREQWLSRGEMLFRAGEPCTAFFCVLAGQVKLTVAGGGGAEKVLEIVAPGETFAEAVMFAHRPYPVTATALSATRLLVVGSRMVHDLISRDPDFARLMLVGMSVRLHSLVRQIASVSLSSAAERVADLVLSLPGSRPGSPVVELPAGKAVLASRLNLSPEHFSRTLRDLADAGLIRVDGRRVTVLDVIRLREVVDGG
jgi:CRP-like cAMP-binding protein